MLEYFEDAILGASGVGSRALNVAVRLHPLRLLVETALLGVETGEEGTDVGGRVGHEVLHGGEEGGGDGGEEGGG